MTTFASSASFRFSVFGLLAGNFRCWCFAVFLFFQAGVLLAQEPGYVMADTAVAKRLLEEARMLIGFLNYDLALEKLDTAEVILQATIGKKDTAYAKVLDFKGVCYSEKGNYTRALEYHRIALDIRLKKLDAEHPHVASSYHNIGNVYYYQSDYDNAIEYYQKALDIRLKKLNPIHPHLAASHLNLGSAFVSMGDYDRAIEHFQKGLDILLKKLNSEHPHIGMAYHNLGGAYASKGDYDRAIEYFQKSLDILIKKLGPENIGIATSYNNLGNAYGSRGDYDLEIRCQHQALEIRLKKLGAGHPDVGDSYINLGNAYFRRGTYDRAMEYYQNGLDIWLKIDPEHPHTASAYHNIGNVNHFLGNYNLAIKYDQTALDIRLKTLSPQHPDVALSYSNLGGAYFKKGENARAVEYSQKALEIRLKTLAPGHPEVTNSYNNLGQLYKSNGNYKIASGYFKKAISSINLSRKTSAHPSSKSSLSKESFKVYEGGIAVNLLLHNLTDSLHYLHEAFDYAEQSKAQILYESMKNADALLFAGISDSLLQRERDLRINIAYNDRRHHDLLDGGKSETDTTVLKISSKIFDLNRAYEALIDTFETHYPDYYRLKYEFSTVRVRGTQDSLLEEGQTLLQYTVGDSSIFIFVVKKDTFTVVEIKKDFPLDALVDSLRISIVEQKVETYCRLAYLLYQKLILPAESLLTEKLIIIPDGKLGYLPFDALLTTVPTEPLNFRSHPYLLRKHQIRYCYSATLLREMRDKRHRKPAKKMLLAFAPFYDGYTIPMPGRTRKNLDPLPHTGEEVQGIRRIAGQGDVFFGKEATKERFIQSAGDYRILHFAQHAQASDESDDYSFLAFAETDDSLDNELLYTRDLYNLSMNADMVVLSACETGIGRLQRGEGVISLGRAFSYAGAKSIVSTLWTVEDEATKNLMLGFYGYLKQGMPKDTALRQTQLDYIRESKNIKAHPFFWAGFMAVGDMRPIFRDE